MDLTITLRQKSIENGHTSLYLDIRDKESGKRKFEFLSLYLMPEIDDYTKAANKETLKRAHEIRAERILHPNTIPEVGHQAVEPDIPNDESPKVMDWIQTYIDWMEGNTNYAKATVDQTIYFKERMSEFLTAKRRQHITMAKFDKEWFKKFFLWLKEDYVPAKYVRVKAKSLTKGTLRNVQQRIVAVFNKAVRAGKIKANPFYQMEKGDTVPKPKTSAKSYLTPDELKLIMASDEKCPTVAETKRAFIFACLTGLRISDVRNLKWSNIIKIAETDTLVIIQKKTKEVNSVPICSTAAAWLPERGKDNKVFHLPALANIDAALKRIAKRVGIEKNISFHTSRHTFGTMIQAATGDIETTKKLMGHSSIKSTMIYADVLTEEKVKAISNADNAFKDRPEHKENTTIRATKRTAATRNHPCKIVESLDMAVTG